MTQLTQNFTLEEMLASPTAERYGYTEQFTPPAYVEPNLQALATNVLEPLRVKLDLPIIITSGYRCPRLNTAIGGEWDSQHLLGEAADLSVPGMTFKSLYDFLKTAGIPFDQLIIEHDKLGNYWVHVSFNPTSKQRGECLIGALQPGGRTLVQNDGFGNFLTNQV